MWVWRWYSSNRHSSLNTVYNQYCILPWQKAEFLSVKRVSLGQLCVWSGLNLKCDALHRKLIDIFVYWKVLHEQQSKGRYGTLHSKVQLYYFSVLCVLPLWCLSDVIKPQDIKQTRIFCNPVVKNFGHDLGAKGWETVAADRVGEFPLQTRFFPYVFPMFFNLKIH